jgi:hypothetical protein
MTPAIECLHFTPIPQGPTQRHGGHVGVPDKKV